MTVTDISGAPSASALRLEEMLSESILAAVDRARHAFDRSTAPFDGQLVLFGAGGVGRRTLQGLRQCGNPAHWERGLDGLPVYSPTGRERE